ncbi:MAG TPA: hypothetical protein VFM68_03460 [Candidatus Saccharimonadales bacterium]|nr:hypothetical protein [Candidatus Saccharimonadales bacterium]
MYINKFIGDEESKPFHSTHYAEAANEGLGAASPQTFSQRTHIDRNRQSVRKYQHSILAHGHRRDSHYQRIDIVNTPVRPEPKLPTEDNEPPSPIDRRHGTQTPTHSYAKPVSQRQNFTEPPKRGYNPYQ